jgi:hypothetical protein
MTTLKLCGGLCAVLLMPGLAQAGSLSSGGAISGAGQALEQGLGLMQQGLIQQQLLEQRDA